MKVYKRLCEMEEEKALHGMSSRHLFRQRKKCFWKIPAGACQFELYALGRMPNGIECDYDPFKLAAVPLDEPDIYQNDQLIIQSGKYRIETKSFTAASPKLNSVRVNFDNVPDAAPVTCTGVDPLGLVIHNVYKKRTHIGSQETLKHQVVKMYFKFKMI